MDDRLASQSESSVKENIKKDNITTGNSTVQQISEIQITGILDFRQKNQARPFLDVSYI